MQRLKIKKTPMIFCVDFLCLALAFLAAYLFRFDFDLLHKINLQHAAHIFALSFAAYMGMFFAHKMHRIIWRYASLHEMVRVLISVVCGFVLVQAFTLIAFGFHYIPLTILPLQAFFYLSLLVTSRAVYRLYCLNSHG